ncbi:cytochrome P450 [Amycolatopsis panacis]|uniref:Cytochrome P450 n=1 Tax=Amycolatopsis panacis TaxID=2340917 RepID=A0A419I9M7_9PSEU|nr:cytochrome P450 [Amycolatopsis panacis]RJQ89131.1 cytochrome P450 [Amycolatopsis panacis]
MPAEVPAGIGRRVDRGPQVPGCPARAGADGVWLVQDYAGARAVLRSIDTCQAGLGIEAYDKLPRKMRRPVLYRDGPEHREHRRQAAQYFTPRRVDEEYRGLMCRLVEQQCDRLRRDGRADLSELALAVSVGVVAEVIGLDGSRAALARRLERFFTEAAVAPGWGSPRAIGRLLYERGRALSVFLFNILPSMRKRRQHRRGDLVSHLLDEGCTAMEVLGECVTFAGAGMFTTREFITLAAFHLFSDDALRAAYTTADEPGRQAILQEILRLEPVVSDLYRRTTAELEVGDATIPRGAKIDIRVAAANLDPAAAGADAGELRVPRDIAEGLTFGDGPHRCPGAPIALQQTDLFLTALLALPGIRMAQAPRIRIRSNMESYELTGLELALR